MRHFLSAVALVAFVSASGTIACARPMVTLKLAGFIVSKDASGVEKLAPLAGDPVHVGERIRWNIVATNSGDSPALHLITPDAIPGHTVYAASSVRGTGKAEFSIDGGKTWSSQPMVAVHTPTGVVMRPADPSLYTHVRWIRDSALAPKQTVSYSFEVLVK